MKKAMLGILSLFLFANISMIFGSSIHQEDKIYVRPETVYFDQNRLFISIEDQICQVNAIACDDAGLFVRTSDLVDGYEAWWICKNGHWGRNQYVNCPQCGAKRGKN